jgi:hypothetical protein
VIGQYVPMPAGAPRTANGTATNGHANDRHESKVDPEKHATMERLRQTLEVIYAATGLTEDEFADLMDPKKPFPYDKAPES